MPFAKFPLFQSHLDLAHDYWRRLVRRGDQVIDATCGKGNDSLLLAELALGDEEGRLWCFDIQKEALIQTRALLQARLSEAQFARVEFIEGSHTSFEEQKELAAVQLVVYNLGYLPGGDKHITTKASTTLQSIKSAQKIVATGGCISLTCYPGHPEGAIEQENILEFASSLPPNRWSCTFHEWRNRRLSPSLLLLQHFSSLS